METGNIDAVLIMYKGKVLCSLCAGGIGHEPCSWLSDQAWFHLLFLNHMQSLSKLCVHFPGFFNTQRCLLSSFFFFPSVLKTVPVKSSVCILFYSQIDFSVIFIKQSNRRDSNSNNLCFRPPGSSWTDSALWLPKQAGRNPTIKVT